MAVLDRGRAQRVRVPGARAAASAGGSKSGYPFGAVRWHHAGVTHLNDAGIIDELSWRGLLAVHTDPAADPMDDRVRSHIASTALTVVD